MAGKFISRTQYWTRKSGTYGSSTREFVLFYPWIKVNHSKLGAMWEPRQDEQLEPATGHSLSVDGNFSYPTDLVFAADFSSLERDKNGTPVHGGNVNPRDMFANVE